MLRDLQNFDSVIVSSAFAVIHDDLVPVANSVLNERSPYGVTPNFHLATRRFQHKDSPETFMKKLTVCQMAQVFMYQGGKFFAEGVLATGLDGVPGTHIRRCVWTRGYVSGVSR